MSEFFEMDEPDGLEITGAVLSWEETQARKEFVQVGGLNQVHCTDKFRKMA